MQRPKNREEESPQSLLRRCWDSDVQTRVSAALARLSNPASCWKSAFLRTYSSCPGCNAGQLSGLDRRQRILLRIEVQLYHREERTRLWWAAGWRCKDTYLSAPELFCPPGNGWLHLQCAGWPTSREVQATALGLPLHCRSHKTGSPGGLMSKDDARLALISGQITQVRWWQTICFHFFTTLRQSSAKRTVCGQSLEPKSCFKKQMKSWWSVSLIPSKWLQARMTTSFGWAANHRATLCIVSWNGGASGVKKKAPKKNSNVKLHHWKILGLP